MEPTYPKITLLLIEQAKSTFKPSPLLLDPDWVTVCLFGYQCDPQSKPLSETDQDCVWGAEAILPRSRWNILSEQADQANARRRQKWLEERKQRREGIN